MAEIVSGIKFERTKAKPDTLPIASQMGTKKKLTPAAAIKIPYVIRA